MSLCTLLILWVVVSVIIAPAIGYYIETPDEYDCPGGC